MEEEETYLKYFTDGGTMVITETHHMKQTENWTLKIKNSLIATLNVKNS